MLGPLINTKSVLQWASVIVWCGCAPVALAFHETPDPSFKWDYTHVNHAGVVFDFDTEPLKRRGLSTRRLVGSHSAQLSQVHSSDSEQSVRFELRSGDRVSDGWRAELRDLNNAVPGSVVSYAIRTLIPQDFPNEPDNSFVLIQWHDQGVPWKKVDDRSPPLALRYRKGRLDLTLRYAKSREQSHESGAERILVSIKDLPRAVWHDFRFLVKWSASTEPDQTGFVQMWHNEQVVVDYQGPVGYFDDLGIYVKFGIYARHDVKSPHVVYHDEYRRRLESLE